MSLKWKCELDALKHPCSRWWVEEVLILNKTSPVKEIKGHLDIVKSLHNFSVNPCSDCRHNLHNGLRITFCFHPLRASSNNWRCCRFIIWLIPWKFRPFDVSYNGYTFGVWFLSCILIVDPPSFSSFVHANVFFIINLWMGGISCKCF